MSTTWTAPAQNLLEHATTGWEGIWSLTYAAGFGALNLAMSVPLGVGVSISYAAMDFRDAQDELEWVRPHLRATAVKHPATRDDDLHQCQQQCDRHQHHRQRRRIAVLTPAKCIQVDVQRQGHRAVARSALSQHIRRCEQLQPHDGADD